MCRVMVMVWGPDASKYAGKSLKLYRDPSVKWGALEVGGIRISEMSDINAPIAMALTATKGNKKAFEVKPLRREQPPAEKPKPTRGEWLDALERRLMGVPTVEAVRTIIQAPGTQKALGLFDGADKARLDMILDAALARFDAPSDDDDFPGDRT